MSPGDRIAFVTTKWGDRPHWEFEATYLGDDDHGRWLGIPPGTRFRRPGMEFTTTNTQVTLVPAGGGWWVATFNDTDGPPRTRWSNLRDQVVEVYVDVTTPAVVDGLIRCTDLDLDVVRGDGGFVMVDDEDEFAEHQELYAYPPDVVVAAQSACDDVRRMAEQHTAPFDRLAPRVWLDRVHP